jgi:hypothetical protein
MEPAPSHDLHHLSELAVIAGACSSSRRAVPVSSTQLRCVHLMLLSNSSHSTVLCTAASNALRRTWGSKWTGSKLKEATRRMMAAVKWLDVVVEADSRTWPCWSGADEVRWLEASSH